MLRYLVNSTSAMIKNIGTVLWLTRLTQIAVSMPFMNIKYI